MYKITYLNVVGYEEDCTPIYETEIWECDNQEEYDFALEVIDPENILEIEEV